MAKKIIAPTCEWAGQKAVAAQAAIQARPFDGRSPFEPANPFADGAAFASPENPFAPPKAATAVPPDAPEGSYEYRLVKGGLELDPGEIDSAAEAVEIRIYWGRNLLHVQHLSPSRSFFIGDEDSETVKCDYFVPEAKLGTRRAPLVLGGGGAKTASAVLLPGCAGTVTIDGRQITVQEAIAARIAQPCVELAGGYQLPLMNSTSIRLAISDMVFEVAGVKAAKKAAGAFTLAALAGGAMMYVLASFAGHAGLLASMAMLMPPLGASSDDMVAEESRYLIAQYLESVAEIEQEQAPPEDVVEAATADEREGGSGTRAGGAEGSLGSPTSNQQNRRYGVQGNAEVPHVSRAAALREAEDFGMIGLLNAGAGGDPNAPTAPWGDLTSAGSDPLSAHGNMWGDSIGEAFGAGGLGLSGIGEGGGGRGEGIGIGHIGTIGHGSGNGLGDGFGNGRGLVGSGHRPKEIRMRTGVNTISGRLPPEVIQRIVRQNFGRFRLCYENGLRNNPNLQGRVMVRFVIGRDGRVSQASGGGDIPDGGVISCVSRAFYGLTFPQPDGGVVTVGYPIMFTPGS